MDSSLHKKVYNSMSKVLRQSSFFFWSSISKNDDIIVVKKMRDSALGFFADIGLLIDQHADNTKTLVRVVCVDGLLKS